MVGWDEAVTMGAARTKCTSINGKLAEIYDQKTLDAVM